MSSDEQKHPKGCERLAQRIADPITRWQYRLAALLNNRVNPYSRSRKQWLLVIFCGISICGLIICMAVPSGRIAIRRQNFQPSHIGLPSGLSPQPIDVKPTDSLTKKK